MAVRSAPAMRTDPEDGRSRPAMSMSMVVLPEPEGPTTARVSPCSTVRLTPFRMLTGPEPAVSVR